LLWRFGGRGSRSWAYGRAAPCGSLMSSMLSQQQVPAQQATGMRQYFPRMTSLSRQASEGVLRSSTAPTVVPGARPTYSTPSELSEPPAPAEPLVTEVPRPGSSRQPALNCSSRENSYPQIAGAELLTEFPKVVHLNIGGHRYMTTLNTLRTDPNSMLGRMFSGQHPVLRDDDGSFVLDRDGRHFHHVLNYLRDGSVPIGLRRVERLELLREVDFYNLRGLYSIVAGPTAAAHASGGAGPWLHSLIQDLAKAEAADFSTSTHGHRVYARLRYGTEYSGDWIVSSPRNLPNVEYELYDAYLARDPITALNKMGAAGFRPCVDPPKIPASSACHSDTWDIMMYKDVWQ